MTYSPRALLPVATRPGARIEASTARLRRGESIVGGVVSFAEPRQLLPLRSEFPVRDLPGLAVETDGELFEVCHALGNPVPTALRQSAVPAFDVVHHVLALNAVRGATEARSGAVAGVVAVQEARFWFKVMQAMACEFLALLEPGEMRDTADELWRRLGIGGAEATVRAMVDFINLGLVAFPPRVDLLSSSTMLAELDSDDPQLPFSGDTAVLTGNTPAQEIFDCVAGLLHNLLLEEAPLKRCALSDCPEWFFRHEGRSPVATPSSSGSKYCSKRCTDRAMKRAQRARAATKKIKGVENG